MKCILPVDTGAYLGPKDGVSTKVFTGNLH